MAGKVFIVGAGPGAADLITLRGRAILQAADVVIHDRLVPRELLAHSARALHKCVEDYDAHHAKRHGKVLADLIQLAREGRNVVRLKGGDPWLFGRGAEEAIALTAAGIAYEIVPGVTAALAAGVCAGIPLTDRKLSSAVAFITGHECRETGLLDWHAIARFPGTLVFYMGLNRLEAITAELQKQGMAPQTPAAAVEWAGRNCQRVVDGMVGDIAMRAHAAALRPPALIIIGPTVSRRPVLRWFEDRPLFGKTILLTRPSGQEGGLRQRLETLGATVLHQPTVQLGPPPNPHAIAAALDRLHEFAWIVFTSANGVDALLHAILAGPRDLRVLGHARLAAIGPHTGEALQKYGLKPDLVPEEFSSEGLLQSLLPLVHGQRVLLARADRGRELLYDELAKIAAVEQLAVYSQRDVTSVDPAVLHAKIDFAFLTSSNVARSFCQLFSRDTIKAMELITISPVTSAAVREMGYMVAAEAARYDGDGMVEALLQLLDQRNSRSVSMQT